MTEPKDKCPRDCQIRLEHLEGGQKEAKDVHGDLFGKINTASDSISKRVKTVTLLGLAAVIVVILGGAFTLLYDQGSGIGTKIGAVHQRITNVHDDLHEVELKVITVQEQMKAQKQTDEMLAADIKEIKENNR